MRYEIKKYHLSGNLEGMKTVEVMNFINDATAYSWGGSVTASSKVTYVVLTMKNLDVEDAQEVRF